MLPLVIIKQKPKFQKWNNQKTIVCILGSGQRASFPKSAASEEAGQGPIPRVGAFLGPGKRPLGPCFLFRSLYVVENLSRSEPSELVFPHRSKDIESHGKWSPTPSPNRVSHRSELAQLKAIEGRRKQKRALQPSLQPDPIRGQGLGPRTQRDPAHRESLYACLEGYGRSWQLWNKNACCK